MTMSHTYTVLEISHAAYTEIHNALLKAGYEEAISPDGEIDMDGLALQRKPGPRAVPRMPTGPIGPGQHEYGTLFACCYGKKPIHKEFCQKRE